MDKQQIKQLGQMTTADIEPQTQLAKALADLCSQGIQIKDIHSEFDMYGRLSGFNILLPFDIFPRIFHEFESYDDRTWLTKIKTVGCITYQAQKFKITKRPNVYNYPHG